MGTVEIAKRQSEKMLSMQHTMIGIKNSSDPGGYSRQEIRKGDRRDSNSIKQTRRNKKIGQTVSHA